MFDWLNNIFETQNKIALTLGTIILIWLIASILKNLAIILEAIEKGYFSLIKLLKNIIKFILLPFNLLIKLLKWLFTIKQRHDYKKSVLESDYNVIPEQFKIPLRFRLNHRINREKYSRFKCIEKAIETQEFINSNLKFITMIETSVGGGKSSLMAGLTHFKTLQFKEMISDKILNTQKILYKVDWEEINSIIENTYQFDTSIKNIIKTILKDEDIAKEFKGFYSNYRQETPKQRLLKDYVIAYCAYLRNNYVMSNYKLFNRLTESFNIDLPNNLFDIKTEYGRHNYYIPSYCVITEDELSLTNLKNTTNFVEVEKSGRDTAMRLFRQLKNETAYYIGAAQNISRNAKIVRELANSYIKIESLDVVGAQKTFSRIYQSKEEKATRKIEKCEKKISKYLKKKKLSKRKKKKLVKLPNKIEKLKVKVFEFYQMQNKIFASGFLKYHVQVAFREEDLHRFDQSSLKETDLFIPMTWAFGTYLKCQFNEFDDFLNDISQKNDSDLNIIDSFFNSDTDNKSYEELIKNKDEEKEKKQQALEEKKKKEKEAKKGGDE